MTLTDTLGRVIQMPLTNKSGGSVAQGDVVVVDLTTAASFTTTTTGGFLNGQIGVVLEPNGIANNAMGMIAFAGPVPKVNLSGSASLGDLFKTHTVAKQAVRHAAPIAAGDFGIVLGTGASPAALLWGLPAGATGAGTGDFSGPASAVSGNLVSFNGTGGKTGQDSGLGLDGWVAAGETWVYASADAPTFTFTIAGVDLTGKYQAGQRIKLTQTTAKYFIITKVAFSTDTTITIYGGTDYTLANAAITLPFYSPFKAPFGFPLSPAKWTVEVTDTTLRTQASPASGTWYNLGSFLISAPIGVWNMYWRVVIQVDKASADEHMQATLSTANNSESESKHTAVHISPGTTNVRTTLQATGLIAVTAKTSHYLNSKTLTASATNLHNVNAAANDGVPAIIRLVSAYL